MKTLEFKLNLTPAQKAARDSWVSGLRWVWNQGLEFLETFYRFHAWDQLSCTWVPCSPVPWQYRKQAEDLISYCWIGKFQACPIPQPYRPLPLAGSPGSNPYFWLRPYFTQKNHPDKLWFKDIPSIFVINTLERLANAWLQYRKGLRGKPHYRSRQTQSTTLATFQAKAKVTIRGRSIRIPGFGWLQVKGLDTRLPQKTQPVTLSICKFASGDYLQLGFNVPQSPLPHSDRACGIEVGTEYLYVTDQGRCVEPPNYFKQSEQRLAQLQRQLSRQKGRKFPKQEGSKNFQKLQNKVARLHEKIARQRRGFNHWHSSNLARLYGAIAVAKQEDNSLDSAPMQPEQHKAIADAGYGQFLSFVEQKFQIPNREFQWIEQKQAIDPLICPACGNSLAQTSHPISNFNIASCIISNHSTVCCEQCGHHTQRNQATAYGIRQSAVFTRSYRGCHRDVRPVESLATEAKKQESYS